MGREGESQAIVSRLFLSVVALNAASTQTRRREPGRIDCALKRMGSRSAIRSTRPGPGPFAAGVSEMRSPSVMKDAELEKLQNCLRFVFGKLFPGGYFRWLPARRRCGARQKLGSARTRRGLVAAGRALHAARPRTGPLAATARPSPMEHRRTSLGSLSALSPPPNPLFPPLPPPPLPAPFRPPLLPRGPPRLGPGTARSGWRGTSYFSSWSASSPPDTLSNSYYCLNSYFLGPYINSWSASSPPEVGDSNSRTRV